MTTIILPTCPKCGCHDIRNEMWVGYKCFKYGYIFPKEKLPTMYSEYEKSDIKTKRIKNIKGLMKKIKPFVKPNKYIRYSTAGKWTLTEMLREE